VEESIDQWLPEWSKRQAFNFNITRKLDGYTMFSPHVTCTAKRSMKSFREA
jgi:hypothetical protein